MKKNYVLLFSLFMALSSFGQTITRIPYLQKGTETGVTIKWRTDINDVSVVEYSTDETFATYSTTSDATPKVDHELDITGLASGTVYYYRIGTGGSLLAQNTDLYFKTHPSLGSTDAYTFWILGGIGKAHHSSNAAKAIEVRDAFYSYIGNNKLDGIMLTGDNADSHGTDIQYQQSLFDTYSDKVQNSIVWSTIGNIDGKYINSGSSIVGAYYDIFSFPTAGESGGVASGTESYYSFDYGNIHFIVLNSFEEDRSVGAAMYNWALNDIQNTTQQWIIGLWHHPPYSKGWHTSEGLQYAGDPAEIELIEMRENIIPMLEANGIDLVIAGHSESYERSYFINGHYGESASFDFATHAVGPNGDGDGKPNGDGAYSKSSVGENAGLGTVYSVNATASRIANGTFDHNAMYYGVKQYGTGVLEIDGNNLSMKFLNRYGVIEDSFTIHKGPDYVYDNGWQDGNDPNGVATDLEDLVVVSGDANISASTTFNTVTVNPEGNLIVDPSVTLTAKSIILESDSDSYSSLLPSSTSSIVGRARYKRFVNQIGTAAGSGNDLVSSPLTEGTMEVFSDFADWNKNIAALNNIRAFAPYNNVSGDYENYDIVVNETTPLEAGKGYRAATLDGSPVVFTGNVNVGNVNTTITAGSASSWNLVGNPYTSYIDAQAFISENGSLGNDVLDSNYNAVYGYNSGTDGSSIWTIINNVQNVGKTIAPGQGFYVYSNGTGGAGNLAFTPTMRTTSGNDDFILGRSSSNSISHLNLKINNASSSYNTDFYFSEDCSSGLDIGYDAGSLDASNSNFSLYSHLVADNTGVDLAIQCLSFDDMESVVVPLGINASSGDNVSISINESDLSDDINIYLEDNSDNTFTLLNANTYNFAVIEDLEGTGRFFLHFSPSTLSIDTNIVNGLDIYTSTNPDYLNVKGKLIGKAQLDLYDVQGRLVLSRELESGSSTNSISVESLQSGVYVVKLNISGITRTEKVIIN
ncbi:T9SS type A sorting domain-containing protein [uncultured Winogradskyella sp.]|uniref:T9SS type A sorting domain-containing protein n=1 Tax=uncultured Winogradskyella sp. TaxID=395353 RepID=UPI00260ED875|nr:T9SS type A sorting domain-containing protein [uncultured Winogradskyella sp.]